MIISLIIIFIGIEFFYNAYLVGRLITERAFFLHCMLKLIAFKFSRIGHVTDPV